MVETEKAKAKTENHRVHSDYENRGEQWSVIYTGVDQPAFNDVI